MSEIDCYDVEALRRLVEDDAGCPEFPALAEAERRAGRAEEARRISEEGLSRSPGRLAGRVSLGLALLDLGDADSAGRALAEILDSALEPHLRPVEAAAEAAADVPDAEPGDIDAAPAIAAPAPDAFQAAVGDFELDEAFAAAEPQTDEMFSANDMAERVLMDRAILDGEEAEDLEMGTGSAYSTETMAGLLDRQGDHEGADAIRRSLDAGDAEPFVAGGDASAEPDAEQETRQRGRILGTLESWLHNIQRGTA